MQHGDPELLKLLCSDIQEGYRGSLREVLQMISSLDPYVWYSRNLMRGISATLRFRIA